MRLLVAEDEPNIASLVRKALEGAGFVVDVSPNGDQALQLAETVPYDALILDIMLPGRDGLSILRQLRDRKNPAPVILLTARAALNERVEGLNLGADDYLSKPFHTEELIARVHAVVRRRSGDSQSLLQAGDLLVNLITREVRRGGVEVELTSREFALLVCLLRSPGRVFTRTQLCERVWDYHHDPGTNLVDVYIQRLRKKLHDHAGEPLIETVRGVGYRLVQP